MADIPVSFNLKSGVFTEQGLRSELATMRANSSAFNQEMQNIQATYPLRSEGVQSNNL